MQTGLLRAMVAPVVLWGGITHAADWVRGGTDGKQAVWGIHGGLRFAIHPATRGPRGLIRVLSPTLPNGEYDLVNFIAVEPIVSGGRGLSELEHSRLDNTPGKRFWVEPGELRGTVSRASEGVESLQVIVHIEKFDNGAHVRLLIEQRSDRPDEIAMTIEAESDSAAVEYCILTATMGNKARARQLWLKDEVVSSLSLYSDYKGPGFTPHTIYPLSKITVTEEGDLLAAITTNEERPADERPPPGMRGWYYGGAPVTQFWKMSKGTWREDVHAVVNARYRYWRSNHVIPGGVAFENFELGERYHPGQRFIFGITQRTPAQLGLRSQVGTPPTCSRPASASE